MIMLNQINDIYICDDCLENRSHYFSCNNEGCLFAEDNLNLKETIKKQEGYVISHLPVSIKDNPKPEFPPNRERRESDTTKSN